jgi:hypothetical protein
VTVFSVAQYVHTFRSNVLHPSSGRLDLVQVDRRPPESNIRLQDGGSTFLRNVGIRALCSAIQEPTTRSLGLQSTL